MKLRHVKSALSFLLIIASMIAVVPMFVFAEDSTISANTAWPQKGDGTETSPYLIENGNDLLGFASKMDNETIAGKYIKLTADIDLNPGWTASATEPTVKWVWKYNCFTGVFDGGGHTVSGIYLNAKDSKGGDVDYVGIFGGILGANKSVEIKNLTIVNSYVCGGKQNGYVGALLGITSGGGTATTAVYSNLYVDAIVESTQFRVGGMVGYVQKGTVLTFENCVFAGKVKTFVTGGEANVGGFVGRIEPSTTCTINFRTCAFYGMVTSQTATDYIGGFVGVITNAFEENDVVFDNCICAGRIEAPTGAKNSGLFCKVSNSAAVLVMKNCLYVDCFFIDGVAQNWNTPINATKDQKEKITETREFLSTDALGLSALSLPCIDQSQWKPSPENNYPLPKTVYYMIFDKASDEDISETPVTKLVGYQVSRTDENGYFRIRLVAVITAEDLEAYSKVGFSVTIAGQTATKTCTTVYKSLLGKDANDTTITYTAEDLGGKYLFALNINGIPKDSGELTIGVTTFHVLQGVDDAVNDFASSVTINTSKLG